MTKRKIVKHGPASLTVTLPMKWAKAYHLKPGDEVDIIERGAQVIIGKGLSPEVRKKKVHFHEESHRYIRSVLGRLYRAGYDEITITFNHSSALVGIKKAVQDLLGADLISMESNKCVVRVFPLTDMDCDISHSILKMVLTLKQIFSTLKGDLGRGKFDSLAILDELRNNNWKMKDYVLRVALIQNVSHERLESLCPILFCYEKIGSKVIGFYKRYLVQQRIVHKASLIPIVDRIEEFLTWIIEKIGKRSALSYADEASFRNRLLKFHISLFNELHRKPRMDHAVLTITYFTTELLDSTISYLVSFTHSID